MFCPDSDQLRGPQKAMSFQVGASGTPLAEINVTPLVDVMLVLLIVFMISAPLLQTGISVNLPHVANSGALEDRADPLVITIQKHRCILLDDTSVDPGTLRARLMERKTRQPEVAAIVRSDQGVAYGYVAQVLGLLRTTGITQISLATDPSGGVSGDPL